MTDREFINMVINSYLSYAIDPHMATLNNTVANRLNDIADKLDKQEMVVKALKDGIYAKDPLNENKLNYIPAVALSNIESEWYLSNHCDFCVNVRDYKELFWLKEDRSE